MSIRLVFGVFLIVHGLIHLSWNLPGPDDPNYPFDLTRSKLVRNVRPELLQTLGSSLVTLAVAEFAVAGASLILLPGIPTLWRVLAVIAALDSIAIIVIYWNRWFVLGLLIDIAIIVAAVVGWPT